MDETISAVVFGVLVPIVGVELAADDGVTVFLDLDDRRGLIVGVGLFVDVVGRAKVERLHAELAGEEALGELYLKVETARRNFTYVRMCVGVVADLVAFAHHTFHDADVFRSLRADHHEGGFGVFLLEDVEDLWSPFGIGPIVEGERDLIGVVTVILDDVSARVDVHVLIDDELALRIGLVGIDRDGALAGLGQAGYAKDIAVPFVVHVVTWLNGAKSLERVSA